MIIDRGLNQKGTDENIGTSRVNLTQRYVESVKYNGCLLYTSPSPRDRQKSRMPSSA